MDLALDERKVKSSIQMRLASLIYTTFFSLCMTGMFLFPQAPIGIEMLGDCIMYLLFSLFGLLIAIELNVSEFYQVKARQVC